MLPRNTSVIPNDDPDVTGIGATMTSASVIEVAGSSAALLAKTAELRRQGWTVTVRGTRLTPACEVVWSLEVERRS
jgi:hypothetical protein